LEIRNLEKIRIKEKIPAAKIKGTNIPFPCDCEFLIRRLVSFEPPSAQLNT
jgi:hypothetical protein